MEWVGCLGEEVKEGIMWKGRSTFKEGRGRKRTNGGREEEDEAKEEGRGKKGKNEVL